MSRRYTHLGIWLLCITAAVLFIRISLFNVVLVSSGSMLPLHAVNSYLLSSQLAWGLNLPFIQQQLLQWSVPDRGDVVIFRNPFDDHQLWMKRVIGLEGDTIVYRQHQLYINGQACMNDQGNRERLAQKTGGFSPEYKPWFSYLEADWGPVTVGKDELFLMGDHRGASIDSRNWGTISTSHLVGRPIARIWPLSRAQWLP